MFTSNLYLFHPLSLSLLEWDTITTCYRILRNVFCKCIKVVSTVAVSKAPRLPEANECGGRRRDAPLLVHLDHGLVDRTGQFHLGMPNKLLLCMTTTPMHANR